MNARATEVATHQSLDDEFAALFGDYAGPAPKKEDEKITVPFLGLFSNMNMRR